MEKLTDEDRKVVRQANLLLEQLNAGSIIGCVEDITAPIFVTLFEGLCGEKLTGIIRSPVTKEDEIQNIQIVIDALASDVLHTSLAHISGRDVVEGNREALLNLLEIFSGLLEYILNKIESDASTDNDDDDEENVEDEDPDTVHPEVIDRILERELHKRDSRETSPDRTPKASHTRRYLAGKNSPLQSPAKILSRSPARKKLSETEELLGISRESSTGIRETTASTEEGDSTLDLIRSAEDIDLEHKLRINSLNGRRPVKSSQEIRDDIARHRRELGLGKDPFADLVEVRGPLEPGRLQTGQERMARSDSFHSLQQMIEETAAMAKEAVDCSPTRAQHILQNMDNEYNRYNDDLYTSPTKSAREPVQSYPSRKTKSPARKSDEDLDLTPSRAKRKVSFLVERSTTSESSPSFLKPSPRHRPCTKIAWDESPPSKVTHPRPQQDNTRTRMLKTKKGTPGSFLDFSSDRENLSYDDYLKKQFQEIIDDVLSDEEYMPSKHKSRNDQRRVRTEKLKDKKGTYTVKDTNKLLEKEKDKYKQKMEFLQKIYQEDLDELANEAEYEINKDRKTAEEIEQVFKKKALTKPKKSVPKDSGAIKKKVPPQKQKSTVTSKAKKSSGKGLTPAGKSSKLTIKDDDDILPMLIKEFPHLHLSLHTWHELWRKGIHQIEQISRANQEVRRKKSKAKAELEEAEKRHGIMVNIMKKELEHGERMKEIKQRQKNAVVTRNLIKEQRSQSARSRQYYDEYQVRMRSKMLKRRTREEMIFKKLFKDGLDIQKDRVKDLRKYAKEQRERQAKIQRNEIESMENYYHDQFDMLAESVTKERQEIQIREKAQQKVLGQMKKELRKKMETEIKSLQDHLCKDDDDAYFRQLDADRVIHNLQMAKYHVHNV